MGEEIEGKFYEKEMQITEVPQFKEFHKVVKTKTVNRQKQFLVSYKGWHSKYNEWMSKAQLTELKNK